MLKDELAKSKRRYFIHVDNAIPHRGKIVNEYNKAQNLRKAPQPEYSPDVAPSNFYLFVCSFIRICQSGIRMNLFPDWRGAF